MQRADVPAAATPRVVLRRFPSASCAFAYPDGWQVVWADLDRGSTWYNAARAPGATADTVTCTVPKAARPTQVVIGNGGSTAGTPVFVVAAPRPWTHSISLGQGVTLAVDRTVAAVGAGPALRLTDVLSPGVRICPDVPEQRRVCGS